MFKTILYIAIGGAIGSVFRYLIGIFINKYTLQPIPFATLFVNVIGCFLIGFFVGILDKNDAVDLNVKYFLITGVCGGFTTFSAFGLENYTLFQNNNPIPAVIYIALSLLLGFLAVGFGLFVAK